MARYFRFDPATGETGRLGMVAAERLGQDNYSCDPTRPFVVQADGRVGAEGVGADWVSLWKDEDQDDVGDLSVGELIAPNGKSWCFIHSVA